MNKLFEFAFTNRAYRLRAYGAAGVVALICGLAGRFSLQLQDRGALILMAVVLYSLIVFAIFYYVFVRKAEPFSMRLSLPFGRALAIFAIFAVGSATIATHPNFVPTLQGVILDRRLERLNPQSEFPYAYFQFTKPEDSIRKQSKLAASIVDIAYRYKIPVRSASLEKAEMAIRESLSVQTVSPQTRQIGLVASAKLTSLATQEKAQTVLPAPTYVFNSTVDLSTNKIVKIVGDNSTITLADGEIYIRDSTVIFDGVNFRGEHAYKLGLIIQGTNSGVIIRNGFVENLDQDLDGVIWENIQFRHSRIKIRGGRFTLINASFTDCDLSALAYSHLGYELQQQITGANGGPISFSFEGEGSKVSQPQ